MLCVPALMLLVLHVAILELAAPAGSATAPQPVMVLPPSLKATVPAGAVPGTVAAGTPRTPAAESCDDADTSSAVAALSPVANDAASRPTTRSSGPIATAPGRKLATA